MDKLNEYLPDDLVQHVVEEVKPPVMGSGNDKPDGCLNPKENL